MPFPKEIRNRQAAPPAAEPTTRPVARPAAHLHACPRSLWRRLHCSSGDRASWLRSVRGGRAAQTTYRAKIPPFSLQKSPAKRRFRAGSGHRLDTLGNKSSHIHLYKKSLRDFENLRACREMGAPTCGCAAGFAADFTALPRRRSAMASSCAV